MPTKKKTEPAVDAGDAEVSADALSADTAASPTGTAEKKAPAAKKAAKPAAKSTVKKAAKPTENEAVKPADDEAAKPAVEKPAKPSAKKSTKTASKKSAESTSDDATAPVAKKAAKKAAKSADAETVEPAEEKPPAKKKPAAKAVAKKSEPVVVVPPAFPETTYAVVEKMLVGFLKHEVGKVGLKRAVLGLSGGVDSAVSAAIAARALGPKNVLGVMMPYQSSSPESLADANAVAEALGIETVVVDITRQVDAYFEKFADASRLRRGNKMARERMTILYDHSAVDSSLVIGTSNKTELLLGYGTLYGDMASALNPIGDLYKTQVWGLARHLQLAASVIDKAPTADLWSGQTDETELGFSYHAVDQLLYRMIDERCSARELVDMGFDEAFVERVAKMIRSSQFKRRLPVIAKLSARTIDTDFRYSRDWGL